MASIRASYLDVESETRGHGVADGLGGDEIGAWKVAPNAFAILYVACCHARSQSMGITKTSMHVV